MELTIYKLISLEHPENQRAHRIARNLFTLKLLLIPILLPFYMTLFSELFQTSEDYLPPILNFVSSYIILPLFCITAGWLLLLPFIPGIGLLAIVPVRCFQYFVGINLEVFYIIPRIFLGSIVDLLQPRKTSQSAPVLYSVPVALCLLVLIPLATMASGSAWLPWYRSRVAAGERLAQEAAMVRLQKLEVAKERQHQEESDIRQFITVLKQARLAETISEAKSQLLYAEDSLRKLPYRQQQDANLVLRAASAILDKYELHEDEKVAGKLRWQRELRPLLNRHIDLYRYLFE